MPKTKAPKKAKGPPYPEHEKLKAVQHQSQTCYDFIMWLESKGLELMDMGNGDSPRGTRAKSMRDLLAEYFEIDQDKLEAEKVAMVDAMRRLNEKS